SCHLAVDLGRCPANLLVCSLQQFREGELDVSRDSVRFSEPVTARLFEKGRQRLVVEPRKRLWERGNRRQLHRWLRWNEISNRSRLLRLWFAIRGELYREQPLMNPLAESVHHTRSVEVDASRAGMLE